METTRDEFVVTRHDFWRACYATMLAELPAEEIIGFFKTIPMRMKGKDYVGTDLLVHLWKDKGEIPLNWNYIAVNALEPFLVEKGHDALGFMRRMLFRNNKSTYMPGKIVMSWFYPIMDSIFSVYDPREMIFKLIEVYTENYLPGHLHPRVKKTVDKEWISSYLMYLGDIAFTGYKTFNFDFIAGEQLKRVPRMLNLPDFEEISYLTDCRSPEEILQQEGFERTDAGLMFNGRLVAVKSRFKHFSDAAGLDLGKYSLPDTDILVATEDLFCPRRNRVVVYKGCAYHSPVYISVIRHRKIGRKEKKFLEHLLSDTLQEGDLFSEQVCEKHLRLIESQCKKIVFAFWDKDESMTVNGVHFTKGVPAKILRRILAAFVKDGKTEFEYREFKREFDISLGQKNSNFEVRFYRLINALAEKCPAVRIEKSERGRFQLKSECAVVFEDHADAD